MFIHKRPPGRGLRRLLLKTKTASYSPTAKYLHSGKFFRDILCFFFVQLNLAYNFCLYSFEVATPHVSENV